MKTLVYKIGYLGDGVVSLPAMNAIRQFYPTDEIVLVTRQMPGRPRYMTEIFTRLGLIDRVVEYDGWFELLTRLRKEKAERLLYLPPSRRKKAQVYRDHLYFKFCAIRKLMGFVEFSAVPSRDQQGHLSRLPHEGEWLSEHLSRMGIAVSSDRDLALREKMAGLEERRQIDGRMPQLGRPYIALCAGAKTQAQKWPLERFAVLGKRLRAELGVEPVILGASDDRGDAQHLLEAWGGGLNLCGEISLFESAEVLRRCALYVGNDTGPMHLAAWMGTACVGIFSARNNPGIWEPVGRAHQVLRKQVACEGCEADVCPVEGHPCLAMISEEEVFQAAKKMLEKK